MWGNLKSFFHSKQTKKDIIENRETNLGKILSEIEKIISEKN